MIKAVAPFVGDKTAAFTDCSYGFVKFGNTNKGEKSLSENGSGGVNSKGNIFYDQTPYQLSLNKSNKFLSNGNVKVGLDNGGKAQADQHTGKGTNIFFGIRIGKTDNPVFAYPQQGSTTTEITFPLTGTKK